MEGRRHVPGPHPLIEPIRDAQKAGTKVEGGYRKEQANCFDFEFPWRDHFGDEGWILIGFGAVGLILEGDYEGVRVRIEHRLSPDAMRKLAYRAMVAADLAERRERPER